jgi:hypothetical protein
MEGVRLNQLEISDEVTYRHVYVTSGSVWDPNCPSFHDNELNIRSTILTKPSYIVERYVRFLNTKRGMTEDTFDRILRRYELCVTGTQK